LGFRAECAPFFQDMPQRIAQAHLVVCRSGASSVSELSVLGRPSILVPLPGAIDQDQAANAKVLEKAGGAWPIRQADLHPQRLAK
jgi:UDP-N-acetylglucosamine--N-acetylmuramyl-(pentapeptide) pyrophosphoryl-undecaprenol N-acetylglucosamine transferase